MQVQRGCVAELVEHVDGIAIAHRALRPAFDHQRAPALRFGQQVVAGAVVGQCVLAAQCVAHQGRHPVLV
ncbi:hypothetical protein G6F58_013895 [Rhizopus delemar]|nr:hypothetical protein G6F58_013895 [Rhizopus delemar]